MEGLLFRLQHGVRHDDLRNPFARESLPAYSLAGMAAVAAAFAFVMLGASVDRGQFLYLLYALWLLAGGLLAKRVGHDRIGTFAEALGLLAGVSLILTLLQTALTAIALPDADATLIYADRLIGFDWKSFADWIAPHQVALTYMTAIYRSLAWQPGVLIALLCLVRRPDIVWRLLTAWFVSLAIVIAIYPFFPAEGGFVFYHYHASDWPGRLSELSWGFAPIIHAIRDGGVRHFEAAQISGLVSFPSFHVAAAVLLAWAAWPIRYVGPVFMALNVAMAATALICGPHYLIDLVAGAAIAVFSIWLTMMVANRRLAADACPLSA